MNSFKSIYSDNSYLEKNKGWHQEDSDWKFKNIIKVLENTKYKSIADVGCGAGKILENFYNRDPSLNLNGYDISDNIQDFWASKPAEINFHTIDFLTLDVKYDLTLLIDVFEHVEDYYLFLRKLSTKSEYFVFHIPLDMFVLAGLTNNYKRKKENLGHLHYYDYNTALGVLNDTGYNILNFNFAKTYLQADTKENNKLRILRKVGEFFLGVKYNSLIFGGYHLVVLCNKKEI